MYFYNVSNFGLDPLFQIISLIYQLPINKTMDISLCVNGFYQIRIRSIPLMIISSQNTLHSENIFIIHSGNYTVYYKPKVKTTTMTT